MEFLKKGLLQIWQQKRQHNHAEINITFGERVKNIQMWGTLFLRNSVHFHDFQGIVDHSGVGTWTLFGKSREPLKFRTFSKIFNSNYVLKFFDFSYICITFIKTTKKGVSEVSGGCLDGVWGLSWGHSRVWVMSEWCLGVSVGCLGCLGVSGRCLGGVWGVSGGVRCCLVDV